MEVVRGVGDSEARAFGITPAVRHDRSSFDFLRHFDHFTITSEVTHGTEI